MQRRLSREAKPTDVACVWRNLRPNQNNIKHAVAEIVDPAPYKERSQLQFARYKFLEFHDVGGEFANTFCCFLRRHCVLIQQIAKRFLIEL